MPGHLAIQQKGFTIKGELICTGYKEEEKYVLIAITKDTNGAIQIVWPSRFEDGKAVDRLLQDLLEKVGRSTANTVP